MTDEAAQEPIEYERMSLGQLGEFLATDVASRCTTLDGEFAGKTLLVLTPKQLAGLQQIVRVLNFLAPFEDEVKRAVKYAGKPRRD